ncbi:RNA repair transcriptional activator RtcR family protein [Hahella ganghwensis]|uniref:RNA repair transcriptional activator RtcR family protein n=1 Tax=Hahella ganghwensis TaxID=286420 RepID=UPI00037E61C8|nr:RNA repair transcriptional activator RtcR family protein [Hahella ganghwensis]
MTFPKVIYSIVGQRLDRASKRRGAYEKRFERRWRPTVSLAQMAGVTQIHLLYDNEQLLAEEVKEDIEQLNSDISVSLHQVKFGDPWELAEVHLTLVDFVEKEAATFRSDYEYLFHITTGTHIQQICIYKLVEGRYFPGKILQTAPGEKGGVARFQVIDLDLSKYDAVAERVRRQKEAEENDLKRGIPTLNLKFNQMIEELEIISRRSPYPILLMGPTGAGKSDLARRIYALKHKTAQISGDYVEVNCATLMGDNAMSALFGHRKGAFTGALESREGLLQRADNGLLFLDEIGELGLEEQAMLLSAIENQSFYPMGSDRLQESRFQLIAGTNRDLRESCRQGVFREDLLARINLWTFTLPGLKERLEDLEPNLDYELDQVSRTLEQRFRIAPDARKRFVEFASRPESLWTGNFRDLIASVRRMTTLSDGGVIRTDDVEREISRLKAIWYGDVGEWKDSSEKDSLDCLGRDILGHMDSIDLHALKLVVDTIRQSSSYAEASRKLFEKSRLRRKQMNDTHRIKSWLQRFDIELKDIPLKGKP